MLYSWGDYNHREGICSSLTTEHFLFQRRLCTNFAREFKRMYLKKPIKDQGALGQVKRTPGIERNDPQSNSEQTIKGT